MGQYWRYILEWQRTFSWGRCEAKASSFQSSNYYNAQAVAIPSTGERDTKPPFSVWTVPTVSEQATLRRKKHIAVFPEKLVTLPIMATCPSDGVLLDPFCGSGTALFVAVSLGEGRKAIGIDISEGALNEAKCIADLIQS
jgi:DNA modification methylase